MMNFVIVIDNLLGDYEIRFYVTSLSLGNSWQS